jgi:elongation factor Ts
MSEIIELIKVLRERTGAGLMDCKSALLANDNDIEKSVTWLREKGIAKNAARAGKVAAEGLTSLKIVGDKAVILEINSETDFVARSDPFKKLVNDVTEIAFNSEAKDVASLMNAKGDDGKTVNDLFTDAGLQLKEKLDLRRVAFVTKKSDELFGSYIHMNGEMTILAVVKGGDQEFADNLAMCIASTNPAYASIDEVSKDELAKEKAVQVEAAKEDPSFAKKPAAIQDKILDGKVQKHFQDLVLPFQEYVLDTSKTVGQAMKEHNCTCKSFLRYKVGEGIEKKTENLAEEVAKQLNK